MADSVKKLNSMRFLESQNVEYEVHTYSDTITDGVNAAEAMGFPPDQVYKTLVVQIKDNEYALVMIASGQSLDLKRFARSIGQKKASMPTQRGAETATGYKKGSIGALALTHKRWGVYLDKAAEQHDSILVNGGMRGMNLKVKVADLVRVLNAKVVNLTGAEESDADEAAGEATGKATPD